MDEANITRIMEAAYAEFEPSLRRRLTAFVRDEATAQDLTQESFVRLLAEVRADRVPENMGGWLWRVGHNLGDEPRAADRGGRSASTGARPRHRVLVA